MLIRVQNRLTGKVNEMDLEVTEEQIRRFENGEFVQNVFPHLTPTEREFLLTGMTVEEQKEIFG
jgi:hypothetical protein